MSNNTIDDRLEQVELVLKTLILFNQNVATALGRRLVAGNDAIAAALASDLQRFKGCAYGGIDNTLHDGYIDNLVLTITGKA
jgi:hypothetical protein